MTRLLTLTTSALALTAIAAQAEEIRCSHQLPPQHHVAQVIDRWAEEVEKLSGGELDVQIFGANSLVDADQNIPAVAKGSIECAFSVNFQWGRTLPIMNVTLAPFAFSDLDMWRKWPSSDAAAFLEEKLREKGVENVVWLFQTNQSVFTSNDRYLAKPEDFQGVKIRGLVPAFDASLNAMGAATSTMPGSEVYQALSTGVIDAAITDVAAAYARKYYEVQDHMVQLPVLSVYFHGYMNPDFYDSLSDKAKAAIKEAGQKAAIWAVDKAEEAVAEAPDLLREHGVDLHVATAEENAALEAAMRPAFDKAFAEATGDDAKKLLQLIDKM